MSINNDKTQKVWDKAKKARGKDPDQYRRDTNGNLMFRHSHGKQSDMGWEVDHSKPVSKGGTDHLNNLNALNWKENRKKSDKY